MDDNNIIINQQVSLPYPFGAHKAFPLDSRSFFSNMEEAQAAVHDAVQLQKNQNGDFVLPNEEDGGADSVYYYGEPIVVAENNAETVGLYIITKAFDEHDEPYGALQNVCSGLDSEYLRKDEANELINGLIQDYAETRLNTDCIDDYLFTNAIDDCGNILPTDGLYAYGLKETNGVLEKCETTKKVLSFDSQTPYNKNTNPLATLETVNNKAEELKKYVDEHIGGGIVPILYSELVEKRNNSQLEPGTFYRITDYVCTTTQEDTQSAGHLFDIIVRADSENNLNENAFAAHHDGDTYFQDSKLEAWQLKYCLDNDKNRFAWADDENGKGVIFYMKDEWNNECPYDFKNIMFKRWAVSEVADTKMTQDALETLNEIFVFDGSDNSKFQARFGYKGNDCTYGSTVHVVDPNGTGWYYTFSVIVKDVESGEYSLNDIEDGSIKSNNYYNDEGGGGFYSNTIKPWYNNMASDEDGIDGAQVLNNIVLNGYYENSDENPYIYGCNNNNFGGNCYDSTFGNHFLNNSFGNYCYYNTFGNDCQSNLFGNCCQSNSFSGGCFQNSFGNHFQNNSFGNYCHFNTFGNGCFQNSFGNHFLNNSFGNYCYNNIFGNNCYQNSFGNSCNNNLLRNDCQSNSFGNNCLRNLFNNHCNQNSFGNRCNSNTFGNYSQTITVFDGVQNCSVIGGTQQDPVKNTQILNGTAGASSQNKLTINFATNKSYTQIAGLDSTGNIRIWNPADPVTLPSNLTYIG